MPFDHGLKGDIAIDTETMGLNPLRDRLCVVQISSGDGDAHLVVFEKDKYDAPNLKKLLQDTSSAKIFHYARFDVAVIYHFLGVETPNVYCTKIASRLCRTYTDCHGLKDLCRELLGVSISKVQQSSYWGAEKLSREQKEYAASDVLHLHDLRGKLNEMLEKEKRSKIHKECCDFIITRAKLDLLGWVEKDIFAYK